MVYNDYYELPPTALSNIRKKLDQMKLTGKNITPQMYTSLFEAELNSLNDKRNKNRALSLEQERINTQKDQFSQTLTEQSRQFDINRDLKEEELSNQKLGGLGSAIGNIGTSALLYDVSSKGEISDAVKGVWNKIAGGGTTEAPQYAPAPGVNAPAPGTAATPAAGVAGTAPDAALTAAYNMPQYEVAGAAAESAAPATEAAGTAATAAESAPLSTAMSYASPAVAGLAAGRLAYQTGVGETVADTIGVGGAHEGASIAGGIAGAGIGGALLAGTAIGGPVGAVIGGIAGIVGGSSLFDDCIICTACNGRDSEAVQIAREYRDTFMGGTSTRGYYVIAEPVVSLMEKHPGFKTWINKNLVAPLVEYGRWTLGKSKKQTSTGSIITAKVFLFICFLAGTIKPRHIRATGEVY